MNSIFKILKKEMRETFRDRKSLMMMLMIPLFIPLIVIGMSALFDFQITQQEEDAKKISFAYELNEIEKQIVDTLELDVTIGTFDELSQKLKDGEIDYFVSKSDDGLANKLIVNRKSSSKGEEVFLSFLEGYKAYLQANILVGANIEPIEFMNVISFEENIIDSEEDSNFFVDYMTQYALLFIIMAITISTTYPATDATAGERERGTLETILTFPIKARDIIIGKYLNITIFAIATGVLSLILAIISLIISGNCFAIYKDMNIMLSAQSILIALLIIILYSFLISGLCIAIASKSKTFKEAQSALTPIQFISFFPGMIAFMIEVKNTIILSLIPFLNFTLVFGDSVNGNLDPIGVIGMILSTLIFIVVMFVVVIKQYKSEKILFAR